MARGWLLCLRNPAGRNKGDVVPIAKSDENVEVVVDMLTVGSSFGEVQK